MNKKPAPFLKDIDCIVFDMDGVITSEQNYWNAAALTVYEMLNSDQYYGMRKIDTALSCEQIGKIRNNIFLNDRLICLLKDRGVNTNWDLSFIVLSLVFITGAANLYSAYEYVRDREIYGFDIFIHIENQLSEQTGRAKEYYSRHGEMWKECQRVFQEWYLGDKAYCETYGVPPKVSGKTGLMYMEQPVIPLEELKTVLDTLYGSGIRLGIGTGRPSIEIRQPLLTWGVHQYFDSDSLITYTEVMKGEENIKSDYPELRLAKPHPYMFLKSIYERNYDDMLLLNGDYDKTRIHHTLIVGDAGADIMAAQAINCKFAAVLTGIAGEKSRGYFEKMGADYILGSIRELID